jgi:maltose O-acetyltransferase
VTASARVRRGATGVESEREKMLAGRPYLARDPDLVAARGRARDLLRRFNATSQREAALRRSLLRKLFGRAGRGTWIEPPFFCDYGRNIKLGDGVYVNFDCVVLDCAPVSLGDNVLIGPAVQIYAAHHPVDAEERATGLELASPIVVEDDAWIGGGAILCPGVRVGRGSTIGAGSVVTRDVPAGVVAAGNPCRVLRRIA